jgi:hypothetical protein
MLLAKALTYQDVMNNPSAKRGFFLVPQKLRRHFLGQWHNALKKLPLPKPTGIPI